MSVLNERRLSDALDECLALLMEDRATVEECLARHPEQAIHLRPLLELAVEMRRLPRPAARASAVRAGKKRMLDAVVAKNAQQRADGLISRLEAWVSRLLFGGREGAGMPGMRVAMAAATAVLLLVGVGLTVRSVMTMPVAQKAALRRVEGEVALRRRGDDRWVAIAGGEQLRSGDTVRTGEGASAVISFFEGSVSIMEEGTELSLREMRTRRDDTARVIVVHQPRGQTYYRVEPLPDSSSRFVVETPTARASVRGTEFGVNVKEDGATDVTVREGLVEVSSGDDLLELGGGDEPVAVLPGWSTNVEPSKPPATPFEAPTPMAEGLFDEFVTPESIKGLPTRTPTPTRFIATATPTFTKVRPTATGTPSGGSSGEAEESQPAPPSATPTATRSAPTATTTPRLIATPTPRPTATPTPQPTEPPPPSPPPTERPLESPTPTPTATEAGALTPPPTERPLESPTPTPTATEAGGLTPPPTERPLATSTPTATPSPTPEVSATATGG